MKLQASRGTASVLACLALAVSSGCKAHANDATPSASAPALSAAAGLLALKAKPWFSGAFAGQYDAKLAPVQVKAGALREWAADDGKQSSGLGKLALQVDDDGVVDGSSDGALGASHATGKVEDDTLRVLLAPSDSAGLHGVLVATRDGDGFKGTIEASSGDSLKVRRASVELKKQLN
jgi:hypothetical protein